MTDSVAGNRLGPLHLDPLAYVIGLEGVALMRAFAGEHDATFVEERLAEITRLMNEREQLGRPSDLPLLGAAQGYDAWSATYDAPGNGLLAPDHARVTSMIEGHPGGVALDVACGTGRYAEWLVGRGYEVIGVDGSPGMLTVARTKLPDVDLRDGDLSALPVGTEIADLAVCALALTHVEELAAPYREGPARRPGTRPVATHDVGDDRSQRGLRKRPPGDVSPAAQERLTRGQPGSRAHDVVDGRGERAVWALSLQVLRELNVLPDSALTTTLPISAGPVLLSTVPTW